MTEQTNSLNEQWINACKVMHIINEKRRTIYLEWKAVKESQGTNFGDEFPLHQDISPSIDHDLNGNEIIFD